MLKILRLKVVNKCVSAARRAYGLYHSLFLRKVGAKFAPAFPLTIHGGENIVIGSFFQSTGTAYLFGSGGVLEIGDFVSLNTNVHIGASGGRIIIGSNVLIGPNVVIRAADHGASRTEIIRNQTHVGGDIVIEDDVWIAANAVILKNVRLGKGCIVGAGAVVTKDVEPYAIVGGVPARKISERRL